MFNALFAKAQATFDSVVGQAIERVVVVIPFLVAAGFGTAAMSVWLVRELGEERGYLVMAAFFAAVGGLLAIIMLKRPTPAEVASEQTTTSEFPTESSVDGDTGVLAFSGADKELLVAALTTAAPAALPGLVGLILRNVPFIAVILAFLYVLSRQSDAEADQVPPSHAEA